MSESQPSISFLRENKELIFVIIAVLFVFLYGLSTLTTKPRLSFDEGFFFEEAHNFAQFGKLDIITAPNTFSGLAHIANSSGFSATLPLAALFSVFGFSVELGRLYSIFWMCALLIVAYLFCRRFFGSWSALGTLLLLVTFPPFHANGRIVVGDIPGFTYFLLSLLFLQRSAFLGGLFLGLCLVARPSVYLGAVAAVCLHISIVKRWGGFKDIFKMGLGVSLSALVSLLIYLPNSLTYEWWRNTALFFKNPLFGAAYSFKESFIQNLENLLLEPTLLYLVLSILIILAGFYFKGRREWDKGVLTISLIYGLIVLFYFLKSPGWFKYLLPLQLVILLYLPSSIFFVSEKITPYVKNILTINIRPIVLSLFMVGVLFSIHTTQLFFYTQIYSGVDVMETELFLKERQTATSTIAFIHTPQIAMFFPKEVKYALMVVNEELNVGENPLTFPPEKRATFVVMADGLSGFSEQFSDEKLKVLEEKYILEKHIGRFEIYQLR